MSVSTIVGVDSYIAQEFANQWVKKQLDLQKKAEDTMTTNAYGNQIPRMDYKTSKQFACRRSHSPHPHSTMVFTIYYNEDGKAIYGDVEQRIMERNLNPSITGQHYYLHEFELVIDEESRRFQVGVPYQVEFLKKAWISLTQNPVKDLRFTEVKDWSETNEV